MMAKELKLNPKKMAGVMRMEGYKKRDIARAVGVTTQTVHKWFK